MSEDDPRKNFKISCYRFYEDRVLKGLQKTFQVDSLCYWRKVKLVKTTRMSKKVRDTLAKIAVEAKEEERKWQQENIEIEGELVKAAARNEEEEKEEQIVRSQETKDETAIELTKIIIHLRVRSRPSIFKKNLDLAYLFSPPRSLSIILKNIRLHFKKKNPKYWSSEFGTDTEQEMFDDVSTSLLNGVSILTHFKKAVADSDARKLLFLKKNFAELVNLRALKTIVNLTEPSSRKDPRLLFPFFSFFLSLSEARKDFDSSSEIEPLSSCFLLCFLENLSIYLSICISCEKSFYINFINLHCF